MVKKWLAILLTAAMSVTLLAGCGGSGDSQTGQTSGDSQTTEAESDTTENTADSGSETASGDLIPITFSRTQDSTMETDIFAKMEGASYEENLWTDLIAERLGYDVQYLWIASDADLQTQKFNAAVAAGTIPDVVQVDKTNLKQLVEADLVVDIAPYFEEYASDFVKDLIEAGGDAAIQAGCSMGFLMWIVILRQLI